MSKGNQVQESEKFQILNKYDITYFLIFYLYISLQAVFNEISGKIVRPSKLPVVPPLSCDNKNL